MRFGSKETFVPLVTFIIVVCLHVTYHTFNSDPALSSSSPAANGTSFTAYFSQNNYTLGLSYGMAVSFTAYALMKFSRSKKCAAAGLAGGLTLSGLLYASGCFLLGCCGSPMLSVYISLFGTRALGFTKPLVFLFTAISVGAGYIWLQKKLPG